MSAWIKVFTTNPDNVLQIPGAARQKERRDCPKLSSDLPRPLPLPNKEGN